MTEAPVKNKNLEPRGVRIRRYLYNRLFPKRQDPLKVSISVAIGIFIGILPTWGIAVVLTIAILAALRLPKIPGVVASFIAVPPTLFFFFYPAGLAVGKFLLPPPSKSVRILQEVLSVNLDNFQEKFAWFFGAARPYFISFLLGTAIVALITALIGAVLTWFIMEYRRKKHREQKTLKLIVPLKSQGIRHENISI